MIIFVVQSNTTMTKITNKKTKCPKNRGAEIWPIPAKTVAQTVGCSENMVRSIRRGKRNADTELGAKIEVADKLLSDGANKLLSEVKRLITF